MCESEAILSESRPTRTMTKQGYVLPRFHSLEITFVFLTMGRRRAFFGRIVVKRIVLLSGLSFHNAIRGSRALIDDLTLSNFHNISRHISPFFWPADSLGVITHKAAKFKRHRFPIRQHIRQTQGKPIMDFN